VCRAALAAFIVLFIVLSSVGAQDTASIAPGDPVRITAPALGLKRFPAVFVALRRDSLVFRAGAGDSAPEVVALSAVTRFEVNHGNRPPERQTLPGAAIGGLVGITIGAIASTQCMGYYGAGGSCHFDPGVATASAGVGALLGAGLGSFIKITRFKTVVIAPDLSASFALSRRSAGLRVTIRL
jgi:hypothetical protein